MTKLTAEHHYDERYETLVVKVEGVILYTITYNGERRAIGVNKLGETTLVDFRNLKNGREAQRLKQKERLGKLLKKD